MDMASKLFTFPFTLCTCPRLGLGVLWLMPVRAWCDARLVDRHDARFYSCIVRCCSAVHPCALDTCIVHRQKLTPGRSVQRRAAGGSCGAQRRSKCATGL